MVSPEELLEHVSDILPYEELTPSDENILECVAEEGPVSLDKIQEEVDHNGSTIRLNLDRYESQGILKENPEGYEISDLGTLGRLEKGKEPLDQQKNSRNSPSEGPTRIVEELEEAKPQCYERLSETTGYSKGTLYQYVSKLEDEGKVESRTIRVSPRGGPRKFFVPSTSPE